MADGIFPELFMPKEGITDHSGSILEFFILNLLHKNRRFELNKTLHFQIIYEFLYY